MEEAPKERYGFVTFSMQWNNLLPGHTIPKTLRYCFYPSDNGAMIQTEGDANNFKFALPLDTYRVLIFNCDAENIKFGSMYTFDAAEASLLESAQEKEGLLTPLYAAQINSLTISSGKIVDFKVEPQALVQQVMFNIKVENRASICSCSAALSGIPSTLKFCNRNGKETSHFTIPFSLGMTENGFTYKLLLLDALNDSKTNHAEANLLKVDFLMTNNRIVTSTVDLGLLLADYDNQPIMVEVNASIDKEHAATVIFRDWNVRHMTSEEIANQL